MRHTYHCPNWGISIKPLTISPKHCITNISKMPVKLAGVSAIHVLVYIAAIHHLFRGYNEIFPIRIQSLLLRFLQHTTHFIHTSTSMGTQSPSSGPGIGGQALLKRRAGSSLKEFRGHYISRHGPIAIPWCLANGVSYYAQVYAPVTCICFLNADSYRSTGLFAGRRLSSRLNTKHSASIWKSGTLLQRWSFRLLSLLTTTIEQRLAKLTIWL